MRRVVCLALAALMLGAAGPEPAVEAKMRAFLERPEQIEAVRRALIGQAAALPRTCETMRFRAVELLIATPPAPRFDGAGALTDGAVRQRFASSGCGNFAPLFNVWVVARPGHGVRIFMAYPGTSSASVELQQQATLPATVAAGREAGGCGSLEVQDTRDLGLEPDAPRPSWREIWLVGGCGLYATVLLRFATRPDGTIAVDVPPEGVRRVMAR